MEINLQIIREARELLKETALLISIIAPALSATNEPLTSIGGGGKIKQ